MVTREMLRSASRRGWSFFTNAALVFVLLAAVFT